MINIKPCSADTYFASRRDAKVESQIAALLHEYHEWLRGKNEIKRCLLAQLDESSEATQRIILARIRAFTQSSCKRQRGLILMMNDWINTLDALYGDWADVGDVWE